MEILLEIPHAHSMIDFLKGLGTDEIVCYKQSHRNIYMFITALVVIIFIITARLLLANKKYNAQLKEKNGLIEEKNKDILDSIYYAKRLQDAILPSMDQLSSILNNFFILYKPKDIISGDFYWCTVKSGKIILVSADCTGHGVPGAILSVFGHNALNQSIENEHIIDPAQLLLSIDAKINRALKQDKINGINDGMDAAICTLDPDTLLLHYAGANNPLYIISDGQLKEIKGAKFSVGNAGEEMLVPPVTNSIQLKHGDSFYIFSDGFVSQFGGLNQKKIKSSGLKKLLLKNYHLSMPEQQQKLEQFFYDWKGSNEQIDDLLIIGVKV